MLQSRDIEVKSGQCKMQVVKFLSKVRIMYAA